MFPDSCPRGRHSPLSLTVNSGWGRRPHPVSQFGKVAVYLFVPGGTPLPPIYWNHHVTAKTISNLRAATSCMENLGNKGVSHAERAISDGATLPPPPSSDAADDDDKVGCHTARVS